MKTRHEMIYDFMLSLASNYDGIAKQVQQYNYENECSQKVTDEIFMIAEELSDKYLEIWKWKHTQN